MDSIIRHISGDFRQNELKRYLIIETALFWGLIFLAWLSYPRDHHYSIMTHTFSFLGSFESKHNPDWWWIFSMAMSIWGTATMPLAFYAYRRFSPVSRWRAAIGSLLFCVGGLGTILVALFPDARGQVIGNWEWTQIHSKAAGLVALGFGVGIFWYGGLLLLDLRKGKRLHHDRFILPYILWTAVLGTGIYYQVKWEFVYADKKAAAEAAGKTIGSHWSEALNTRYAFPLWENLVIYTMFIFLVWFALATSVERAGEEARHPDS